MDDARFDFGENWRSYAATVSENEIAEAERGLRRLFPNGELKNARVLDIGCGSGIHALAAGRLGARSVFGIDFDPNSVQAARALAQRFTTPASISFERRSVFDLDPGTTYDIVYSWGVLHHTGAMWEAMERAVQAVAPNGILAVALYRRTPLCAAWTIEKRIYTQSPALLRGLIALLYKTAFVAGLLVRGRNPRAYIANYRSARGMEWHHDVNDWLGGYPYESTTPDEVRDFLARHGFTLTHSFEHAAAAFGLFGSHCDEFVARKGSA